MAKAFLHGPIERFGFLLACVGIAGTLVGAIPELPSLDKPPNRPEFNSAWAKQWHQDYEMSHRQRAPLVIDPAIFRADSGDDVYVGVAPPLEPLPPRDPKARWTASRYVSKFIDNLERVFANPVSWDQLALSYGIKATLIGVFLWLAYRPTLGRLLGWIRHGKAEA